MSSPDIVFKHHRDTDNLGDAVCSPFDYVPDLAARGLALDLSKPTPPTNAVIYGGGKIMGGLRKTLGGEDFAARHRIAWGVSTVQSSSISIKYWRAFRCLDLVGTRDWGDDRFIYAPCVTCLAPYFDEPHCEEHDVVLYLHHWKSSSQRVARPKNIPARENNDPDFAEVIRFLGSGRIVVSNSYHGVYWGLLLGKKVLCLPFSNKFKNYRVSPGYADAETWPESLDKAQGSDEVLGICRNATRDFSQLVRSRIDENASQ